MKLVMQHHFKRQPYKKEYRDMVRKVEKLTMNDSQDSDNS